VKAAVLRAYWEPLSTEEVTTGDEGIARFALMPAVIPAANDAIMEVADLMRMGLDPA
jgi:hypothetical protein